VVGHGAGGAVPRLENVEAIHLVGVGIPTGAELTGQTEGGRMVHQQVGVQVDDDPRGGQIQMGP